MLRAVKGAVQCAGTLALYSAELDALYASSDQLSSRGNGELVGVGRVSDSQQILGFIRQSLVSITGWSEDQLSATDDFFSMGLDSF
jgi:hypothetical protein